MFSIIIMRVQILRNLLKEFKFFKIPLTNVTVLTR